jgi:hypothetical protein
MGFSSKNGRPYEMASKSSHTHIINDAEVKVYLAGCNLPKACGDVEVPKDRCAEVKPPKANPVKHVIAVDAGYTEVPVQKRFPSSTVCFFQFGVLQFSVRDLEEIDEKAFIDPDDIAKLKTIERLKLVIPVRNVTSNGDLTLTHSIRRAVYEFYLENASDDRLIDTLAWLLYRDYGEKTAAWTLASCPECDERQVVLARAAMAKNGTFKCPHCSKTIYLTDVFRLHEAIDDEIGAGGVLAYLMTSTEQLLIAHMIRIVLKTRPDLMKQIMFIKDGPLAFFGQTGNLHVPMRDLVKFLLDKHDLYYAGLEKSGAFVEHATEIATLLNPSSALLLDDEHIYKYVMPGKADESTPYGRSTYYSHKVIFKTASGQMHVVSVPTREVNWKLPKVAYPNLDIILANVTKLKCDMYDGALLPIALVNKLVSLADHPSRHILQQFAVEQMGV